MRETTVKQAYKRAERQDMTRGGRNMPYQG